MKSPSPDEFASLCAEAVADIDMGQKIWPHVASQGLLGKAPAGMARPLPVSKYGYDGTYETSPEGHSDPTGETASSGRPQQEAADARALLAFLAALDGIHRVTVGLENAVSDVRQARETLQEQIRRSHPSAA